MSRTSHRRASHSGGHDQPAGRRARKRSRTTRGAPVRRALKTIGALCVIGFVGVLVLCGVAYAMTEIPPPNESAQAQTTVVQWRDGSKMATLGSQRRFRVPLSKMPDHLQKAVLSAEDRDFYNQSLGISPTGIARAIWVNLTSDDLQGASTITQQYAQSMYLETGRALTTKFKEFFLTLKLEQKMSKDEILEGYLNTIYFGRGGTYGIEAASRAYFHKHASQLTVSESAFLAAVLNSPGNYDPYQGGTIDEGAKQAAVHRWHYVINGMVQRGWISSAEAKRTEFPKVYPPRDDGDTYGGTRGYILKRVEAILRNRLDFTKEEVFSSGLTVRTTLDKKSQRAAKHAVERTLPDDWPYDDVETGLVSVQPGSGDVMAMYGGKNYLHDKVDNVYASEAQVGSSFKPYVLAAALEDGTGLRSRFDGDSPQSINGQDYQNASGNSYGMVDLIGATQHSINTAYVHLGLKTGLDNVQRAAIDAGLPKKKIEANTNASLFLGSVYVRPVDQAAAMATFANGGVYAQPHLLRQVRGAEGDVLMKADPKTHRAFSADVAADVAYAMQQVLAPGGTAEGNDLNGRDAAGKTGTVEDNTGAWFVGYTPQLSTAVAMFNPTKDGGVGQLRNIAGYSEISGDTLPAPLWQAFMGDALSGKPAKSLPDPAWVGEAVNPAPPETPEPAETWTPPSTPAPRTTSPSPAPTAPQPEPSQTQTSPLEETPGGPGSSDEPEPTSPRPGDDDECFPFCSDGAQGQDDGGSQQREAHPARGGSQSGGSGDRGNHAGGGGSGGGNERR